MQFAAFSPTESDQTGQAALERRARELMTSEIGFVHEADFRCLTPLDIENERPAQVFVRDSGSRRKQPQRVPRALDALVKFPLLSPEGERWLFRKYNYFKFRANALRSNLDPQFPDEVAVGEIEEMLKAAFEARSRLTESNLRLVVSIAARFTEADCPLEELVSEGNVVLLRAIELFNVNKGYRFSTYATHSIQRHFYRLYKKRQRAKSREAVALDVVESEATAAPEGLSKRDQLMFAADDLRQKWDSCLSPRERCILSKRYGLEGDSSRGRQTLENIGRELGISKERVRQIQVRAERKLRENFDLDQLQSV